MQDNTKNLAALVESMSDTIRRKQQKKGGDGIAAKLDNVGADVGNRKVTYRSKKSLLR